MVFDMYRVKLKGKRGMYCQSDGTQKSLPCTCNQTLQGANAILLTVVLCDLTFVSLEEAMLHCSEPSAFDLSGRLTKTELQ